MDLRKVMEKDVGCLDKCDQGRHTLHGVTESDTTE